MKPEDVQKMAEGATIASMKPYIDTELSAMQRAVVSSVLMAVNNGTLTPEMAMAKWMEYISYEKLGQKLEQKVRIGVSIGQANKQVLDKLV